MPDEDQAAPGLLASTLLGAAEAHAKTRPSSASSGLDILDDVALHGGFRYGEITSIAGGSGSGKTLVGCLSTRFYRSRGKKLESASSLKTAHHGHARHSHQKMAYSFP